ncbi:3-hydroxyacyl-CoA dehydrogenase family protein [Streptomyces aureus]
MNGGIARVGVVGGGRTGAGIAEVCARAGMDTVASIAEPLYAGFREPLHAPSPLLRRVVRAGLLGRRTGRGFHRYDQG